MFDKTAKKSNLPPHRRGPGYFGVLIVCIIGLYVSFCGLIGNVDVMPGFKSSRKVQGFGSSLAVTLPALFVKACEIEKGLELEVLFGLDGVLVVSYCSDPVELIDKLMMIVDKINEKNSLEDIDEHRKNPKISRYD